MKHIRRIDISKDDLKHLLLDWTAMFQPEEGVILKNSVTKPGVVELYLEIDDRDLEKSVVENYQKMQKMQKILDTLKE
jgi:hypothetical protein